MFVATVVVGWTSSRPIVVDEHVSTFVLAIDDDTDPTLLAAQWAASRPSCEMPTSTEIAAVAD